MSTIDVQNELSYDVRPSPPVKARMRSAAFVLLFFSYVLNQLDRTVLAFVGPTLKADLKLSDTQFGVLTGLAFSLTYGLCSFVFAYFADRRNRSLLLSGALLGWSLATVACAFAGSFRQLVGARMAVAVGEAAGTPTTLGLIGELVPRDKSSSAYAIFMLATPVGILLAAVGGGYIAAHYGWRMAFLISGLPGIVLAAAIPFFVKEPRPGAPHHKQTSFFTSIATIFRELVVGIGEVSRIRSGFRILVAYGFAQFLLVGLMNWGSLFFSRYHAIDTSEASVLFGLALIFGLVPGLAVGGIVTDRLARVDVTRVLSVPIIGIALAVPFYISAFWTSHLDVALGLLTVGTFLAHFGFGGMLGGFNGVLPSRIKALGNAILLFFATMLSQGLGSFLVGLLSDQFRDALGGESLRVAIVTTTIGYGSIAFLLLILARRYFRSDLERAYALATPAA